LVLRENGGSVREIKLSFDEIPPNLNDIIGMCQRHWGIYGQKKAYWKEIVRLSTLRVKKFEKPVDVELSITFPTKRKRDKDNYLACGKFILDGLTCLTDDNSDYVKDVTIKDFKYEKGISKIEVVIKERDD